MTACKYKAFEVESGDMNTWSTLCGDSTVLCPRQYRPEYMTPVSLTRRGLQVSILLVYILCNMIQHRPVLPLTTDHWLM